LAVYRGYSVEDPEVTKLLANFQDRNLCHFCDWMPYHFVKAICETPPKGQKISAATLINHSGGAKTIWGNILSKYSLIFKRKAYLHWFYAEGCSEEDFKLAEEEVRGVIEEYTRCETEPPTGWQPVDPDELTGKCMEDEIPIQIEKLMQSIKLRIDPNC